MSYGVCPGNNADGCGWEGVLRSVRFQMPNAYAAVSMEGDSGPLCLTCRHEFRREMRKHGATEMRVTEVTSTT